MQKSTRAQRDLFNFPFSELVCVRDMRNSKHFRPGEVSVVLIDKVDLEATIHLTIDIILTKSRLR